MAFADIGEIEQALDLGIVTVHSKIFARIDTVNEDGKPVVLRSETTPGRMRVMKLLPKNPNIKLELVNRLLTNREITNAIDAVYRHCGQKETVLFADHIMSLGFYSACKSGISFGKDDLIVPVAKEKFVGDAQDKVKEYEQQYQDGLITQGEKYNKVVDVF